MGQAKIRKATDPNYGKPSTVRGLIISPPMRINGSRLSLTGSFDQQDLRTSLLYWDRLLVPTQNAIGFEDDPDIKFLKSSGVLGEKHFSINGDVAREIAKLPAQTLKECEKSEPNTWSLGTGPNSILIEEGFSESMEGTLLTLKNALPTPGSNVPLAEILNFRQKRRDQLLALRSHLDELTSQIINSADAESELKIKLKQLDHTCADLAKVCKEWRVPIHLTNLKSSFNFNISKAMSSGAAAWTSSKVFGLGETTSIILAGIASLQSQIECKPDINFRSIRRERSPFKYAYEAQLQLQ